MKIQFEINERQWQVGISLLCFRKCHFQNVWRLNFKLENYIYSIDTWLVLSNRAVTDTSWLSVITHINLSYCIRWNIDKSIIWQNIKEGGINIGDLDKIISYMCLNLQLGIKINVRVLHHKRRAYDNGQSLDIFQPN